MLLLNTIHIHGKIILRPNDTEMRFLWWKVYETKNNSARISQKSELRNVNKASGSFVWLGLPLITDYYDHDMNYVDLIKPNIHLNCCIT
jgi:hypothetical protein